jgi:hypothetical protein
MLNQEQMDFIRKEFEELAKIKYQTLADIAFEDLDFNPFILMLMHLTSADEIAEFMISQRVERSLFTTYGHRIQKIAKVLSQTPKDAGSSEVVMEKDGIVHHIHMKAGPNTVNKGISTDVNLFLEKTRASDPTARIYLGMTYGKRSRVSGIIQRYSQVNWLMGREFWEFITGDPDCARKIFDVACEVAETYRPPGASLTYRQLKLPKMKEIAQEIRRRYGSEESEMWRNLLEDNV